MSCTGLCFSQTTINLVNSSGKAIMIQIKQMHSSLLLLCNMLLTCYCLTPLESYFQIFQSGC